MKCAILGPSDFSKIWRFGKIKEKDLPKFIDDYGKFLSQRFDQVFITPDDRIYLDIAKKWGEYKGKKAIRFYPDKDTFYGFENLKKNFKDVEARPNNSDWFKLTADIAFY